MYIFSIPSRSLRSSGSRERNNKENRGPLPPPSTISSSISYLTTTFEVIADSTPEVYGDIEDEGASTAILTIIIKLLLFMTSKKRAPSPGRMEVVDWGIGGKVVGLLFIQP